MHLLSASPLVDALRGSARASRQIARRKVTGLCVALTPNGRLRTHSRNTLVFAATSHDRRTSGAQLDTTDAGLGLGEKVGPDV